MSGNVRKIYSQRDKDIIFGFLKHAQELLPYKQNTYYTIPPLVGNIILPYYSAIEYFTDHGKGMEVCDNNYTCKNVSGRNTVYGAFQINNRDNYNILIWDFLLNIPNKDTIAVLGIDGSNKEYVDKSLSASKLMYGWQCSLKFVSEERGNFYVGKGVGRGWSTCNKYGGTYAKSNSRVRMEIDVKKYDNEIFS